VGYLVDYAYLGAGYRCSCGTWVGNGTPHECPVTPSRTNGVSSMTITVGDVRPLPEVSCARCNAPLTVQYRYGVPGPVRLVAEPHTCPKE
jgi:hypothetical protein